MRLGIAISFSAAVVLLTAACGCGDSAPRSEPGWWFVVDPHVNHAIAGQTVYHHGPAAPAILNPPEGDPARLVIVSAVVSADGRIARAKIVLRPQSDTTEAEVVALLRQLRFRPAMLHGRPVAVYYNLALPLPRR